MSDDLVSPRMVSIAVLRAVLLPKLQGWSWASDAIVDLWKMGAPDPQHCVCPKKPRCPELTCPHVKRLLLPRQFAKWWKEVADRQGYELTARMALEDKRRNVKH